MDSLTTKSLFETLFFESIRAADPAEAIRNHLPTPPKGRVIVIGAGKSTGKMAEGLERHWNGPLEGVIVVPHGHSVSLKQINVLTASHPVPDDAGIAASKALIDAVTGLTEHDLVIALISGGGSSLLPAPPDGMSLDDEMAVNQALLNSGAPITAMNTIRKHLSRIKGGQLALKAHPARVYTLIVSDIPGDNPSMVASGPTVPDNTNRHDALRLIETYRIALPDSAHRFLSSPEADLADPTDPRFQDNEVKVIASASISLEAVSEKAKSLNVPAVILSEAIEGEAREIGAMHAAIAKEISLKSRPFAKPVLLISGGETTVTMNGTGGKGGRNSEFLLSLAMNIQGYENIWCFAADTDGRDGSEHNAGAFADGSSVLRMKEAGLDAATLLNQHDAWTAFHSVGDLFESGPTGTNVNDLRMILIR